MDGCGIRRWPVMGAVCLGGLLAAHPGARTRAAEPGVGQARPADLPSATAVPGPTQPTTPAARAPGTAGVARLGFEELSPSGSDVQILPIDLPTALRAVNASNPTIAVARARLEEAYARLRQAEVLVLPNLQGGPAYLRHDGQIQNALGLVFPTSKQNFFIGGGTALIWDTGELLFARLIARQLVQAEAFNTRAVTDNIQLEVALAYLDLLQVYGQLAVNAETLDKAELMMRLAESAERNGLGKTPADANRARTEVDVRRQERIDLEGQAAVVSARLAQLLLLDPSVDLRPTDPAVVPITLVPLDTPLQQMVSTAVMNRPELAASRSLAAAAEAGWRQARLSPLLPRLEVDYSAGDFGGGINEALGNWAARGDGTAQAVWTLHNLGAGDVARARAQRAQFNATTAHIAEVMAQVGAEVSAAAKQARSRDRSLEVAQHGVQQAEELWRRLAAGAFGINTAARRYDPLEPLLAEQALSQARLQYLAQVIEYNRAQFRLYTAMGQPPLAALPTATAIPVSVPVVPSSAGTKSALPSPRRVEQAPKPAS